MPKELDGRYQSQHKISAAREMRHDPTPAEAKFWELVRRRAIEGFSFRRQYVVEGFIADFVCLKAGLIVEIDGGIHDAKAQAEKDFLRETILKDYYWRVIRFRNDDVLLRPQFVVETLKKILREAKD